jgi:hypothetical protein
MLSGNCCPKFVLELLIPVHDIIVVARLLSDIGEWSWRYGRGGFYRRDWLPVLGGSVGSSLASISDLWT